MTSFRFQYNNRTVQFQAGPDVTVIGGATIANALQTFQPSTNPYLPIPQLNTQANEPYGDLVSGSFAMTTLTSSVGTGDTTLQVASGQGFNNATFQIVTLDDSNSEQMQVTAVSMSGNGTSFTVQRGINGTTAAPHSLGVTILLTNRVTEDGSYNRNDFLNTSSGQNAFLSRKRRTKTYQGTVVNQLDNEAGASSSGNAVPLLFSRAAQFSGVSPPRTGITVRATAIGGQVRAKTIGVARSLAATQLAASVQLTDTTLDVADGSDFPSVAPFPVLIDSEIMLVTALGSSANTWTVQRGTQGTTASAHSSGAQVQYNLPGPPPFGLTQLAWKLGTTTLAASVPGGVTTLTVPDISTFPSAPFRVIVDTENLLVNAIDASNAPNSYGLTLQNASTAAHQSGTLVQQSLYYNVNPQGQITLQQTALAMVAPPMSTTLTVLDNLGFPTTFPFSILIGTETLTVTSIDSTNAPNSYTLTLQNATTGNYQKGTQVQLNTTLAATVQTADMTLTVSSGPTFPSAPFPVAIDSEILLVTNATNPNSWTVQRGWLGTTAAQHSMGAQIQLYAGQWLLPLTTTLTIGQQFNTFSTTRPSSASLPSYSMMPLFDNVAQDTSTTQGMVVGFGGMLSSVPTSWNSSTNLCQINLTKLPGALIPQNASATFSVPSNVQNSSMLSALFQSHNSLPNSILAPALVR